jgi:hypothetical protein
MVHGEQTDIYKQLKARQARAEADPLEIGISLAWSGPSLDSAVNPPLDYPHKRSSSPNALRALETQLFDSTFGVGARPWSLTLVEPLKTGTGKYAQVWRAEADPGKDLSTRIAVVVKLFQESLMPIPEDEAKRSMHGWHQTEELVENEARAYR